MKMNWKAMSGIALCALWLLLAAAVWFWPSTEVSDTERRELAQFPDLSAKTLLDGTFMEDFESYTLDQFPLRDGFRSLKARVHYGVLRQKDNHGIYLSQGYAAQLEYPLNEASVSHGLQVFEDVYHRYLQDSRVFFSVIPDKSYYLAQNGGYPSMDYDALFQKVQDGAPYASYVNLTDTLSAEDYYRTDTHWRQERLTGVTDRLCSALEISTPQNLRETQVERSFYGVYYGQAALPMEPDILSYLQSPVIDGCRVYHYETDSYQPVYDLKKLEGKDLYEVFLSGPVSLLRIENPQGPKGKELILFRDSYGSSLAPLLVQGYESITLVDLRYVSSKMLDRFLDFHGQDVLFLYSTIVLNNSFQIK